LNKNEFEDYLSDNIIFLDGATGTNLMKMGMPAGVCPEKWILEHEDVIVSLQSEYVKAGSNIIYAPTFTANRIKLAEYELEDDIEYINKRLVALSKKAAGEKVLVAGDITMTGRQLEPMGTMTFDELVDVYKEQISYIYDAGADLIVLETMMSLQECRAAVIACKEVCDLPIIVSLTFEGDGRTLYGTTAPCAAIVLESMGVSAIGANCSTGPKDMEDIIKSMASVTNISIIAKPNAGFPKVINGETIYDMKPSAFADEIDILVNAGATLIGGCCGSTPDFIRELAKRYQGKKSANIKRKDKDKFFLTSEREYLSFGLSDNLMIVGERINPTGKKKLQEELREGNLDMVVKFAKEQEEEGAKILDINVGMSGIDEMDMMKRVLTEVMMNTSLPLCIDSSNVDVIEMALKFYPGRALVNSVSLEEGKAQRLLPLIKKYGAMFILLPVGREGIPKDNEEKKKNILELTDIAKKYGLGKKDIVVDGLVATVGAQKDAAVNTLHTFSFLRENNYASICGLSNISFGLPQRSFVNTAFLTMAIDRGLTMAIANPSQELLVNAAFASDLLKNKEDSDIRYIDRMRRYELPDGGSLKFGMVHADAKSISKDVNVSSFKESKEKSPLDIIYDAVYNGNKRAIKKDTKKALDENISAQDILNKSLMPAIDKVGEMFDIGKFFLPQLIASADAMKMAIEVIEPYLKENDEGTSKATVIIATVHGDVHDIGKNLVALMLKNCGYNVIDLGKDVESELIVDTAIREDAKIIALSALMTTTMTEMKNVIKIKNEKNCSAKVVIGGACVTQDYATEIGADGFSKDAAGCVKLVDKLLL